MSQASADEIKSSQVDGNEAVEVNNQPNVRHIPIFVEGRDEPIINKNITINPEIVQQKPAHPIINDAPDSIFSRVKNIPVRKPTAAAANFEIPIQTVIRPESPAHNTIPIQVEHVQTKCKSPSVNTTNNSSNSSGSSINSTLKNDDCSRSRSQSPLPPQKPMDSITKIQLIQKEIIELMKKVENFKATSRKDKEYLYLDEMLTQNLLKLDTIDTEGKENIKAARKEAINCINKCIAVLEAKVEQAEKDTTTTTTNNNAPVDNATGEEYSKDSQQEKIDQEKESDNKSSKNNQP